MKAIHIADLPGPHSTKRFPLSCAPHQVREQCGVRTTIHGTDIRGFATERSKFP